MTLLQGSAFVSPNNTETDEPRSESSWGGVAAPQGQCHDLDLHQRPWPAPASRRVWTRSALPIYCHILRGRGWRPRATCRTWSAAPGRHGISNACLFSKFRDPGTATRRRAVQQRLLTVDPDHEPDPLVAPRPRNARRCGAIRRRKVVVRGGAACFHKRRCASQYAPQPIVARIVRELQSSNNTRGGKL